MTRNVVAALALSCSMVPSLVHADSWYISVGAGSKAAAKIGPPAFTGQSITPAQQASTVQNALKLIKSNPNAAVRMDAVAHTFGNTFVNPTAIKTFKTGLAQLAKSGKPEDKFIRSYATLVFSQRDKNKSALAAVDRAAAALPTDPSIQFGAFRANAENGQVAQATSYLKTASALGASSSSTLVKNELKATAAWATNSPYQGVVQ